MQTVARNKAKMRTISPNFKYTIGKDGIVADIQDFLKNKENNWALDIGCEKGTQLYPFIDFGFSKLIGIDINPSYKYKTFNSFLQDRNDYKQFTIKNGVQHNLRDKYKSDLYWKINFPEMYKLYDSKFEFIFDKYQGNIINYFIKENSFDLIIASNVLHFLDPETEDIQLKKLTDGLKERGIIYISVNQFEKTNFSNNLNVEVEVLNDEVVLVSDKIFPFLKRYFYTKKKIDKLINRFPKTLKLISNPNKVAFELIAQK